MKIAMSSVLYVFPLPKGMCVQQVGLLLGAVHHSTAESMLDHIGACLPQFKVEAHLFLKFVAEPRQTFITQLARALNAVNRDMLKNTGHDHIVKGD